MFCRIYTQNTIMEMSVSTSTTHLDRSTHATPVGETHNRIAQTAPRHSYILLRKQRLNPQTARILTSHKGPTWAWEAQVLSHLYVCNNQVNITYHV